ncbi:MAG: hypothetical protein OK457_01335 [Thaumarchaeota archaeon]|nr:hypothetical protein [Nitrososphaerota archaeon]
MGRIGESSVSRPEVGVATSNGKAYFSIVSLLKKIGIPFVDVLLEREPLIQLGGSSSLRQGELNREIKVIITTRKERLQLYGPNVICVEDLGDDVGLACEKLLVLLYPPKPTDWLIMGIDPGNRTGVAVFINHREVESRDFQSLDKVIERVSILLDNAPEIRKIVKIGAGNRDLAQRIAGILQSMYRDKIRIQLVDESGTSVLRRKRIKGKYFGTRDQRAAKLIAYREGRDF